MKDNYVLEQEDNYEHEHQLSDEQKFRIQHDSEIYYQNHPDNKLKCRIRKLTPKECYRLMGFDDKDFDNAKNNGVSNSQLYKQAGNSIVVNVLMAIFSEIDFNLPKENNE